MFASFETSARSLRAQQRALDVTANNIANVNTPGYTRQEVILSETDPTHYPQTFIGTGVVANDVKQYREAWLDREMRNNLSRQSNYDSDNKIFLQVQNALNEPSDYGLDSSMDKFFSSIEQLSAKPDDMALRANVLSNANALATNFNTTSSSMRSLRGQVYQQMDANVTQINRLLKGIAELNTNINSTRTIDGETSSTLLDKQNVLIEQLSKLSDISVSRTDNGLANISMSGTTVLVNDTAMTVKLNQTIDPSSHEITAGLSILDARGTTLGTVKPGGGEVASQLKFFNVTLDDKDSSGGFSVAKNIDTLANAFAAKVNSISQTGYGLNDTGTTPPGRSFFVASDGGPITAFNISVDPNLAANPQDVPAASAPGEPGNNDIIRQIGQLVNNTSFIGNQTAREYYGQTLTTLANIGADAQSSKAVADATVTQISSQRESVVGVNIDEEAVNMIKYQRAFEAAARMVSTTSDIMKTIVNLGA